MENFLHYVENVNTVINGFVWGVPALSLLICTGVLMTFLTKFFQVSHFGYWLKKTIGSIFNKNASAHTKKDGSVSQFQALCTALAATVGVGNIAGVASAIISGGPGAVFWMWVAAFFGMMTNYSENVLGIFYRRKNSDGEWIGGAMYYLQDGLGSRRRCKTIGRVLAIAFSVFCIFASFGIGNAGQIGNISSNIQRAIKIPALSNVTVFGSVSLYAVVIGVVLMIIAALVIVGGIKRIASVTEKLVPFMVIVYIIGTGVIICINYQNIIPAFFAIFKSIFGIKSVAGGVGGYVFSQVVTMGFKRGVFSNEAGLGSSVMVHSASNVKEPVKQGMWGIFEVFADTMVICTLTALAILTSGVIDLNTGVPLSGDKDTLVLSVFEGAFGSFGGVFIAVAILLFAFSTTLGWSYYGTKAWEYLFGTKSTIAYKIVFVLFIIIGATIDLQLAWDISDTFNGLMAIPNLIGVIALSGTVAKITRNYVDRKIKGKNNVEPMLSFDENFQREFSDDVADE